MMTKIQTTNSKFIYSIILISMLLPNIAFGKIDKSLIKDVEKYFNNITTIKANFTQIDSDGTEQTGIFYLSKPEKLRWEYVYPKKMQIITNENLSMVYDEELEETYFCTENCGPKYFLSRNKINLEKDVHIIYLEKNKNEINFTFSDPKDKTNRIVSMKFNSNPIKIKTININEEDTMNITINFSDIISGIKLNKKLFSCTDPKFLKQKF